MFANRPEAHIRARFASEPVFATSGKIAMSTDKPLEQGPVARSQRPSISSDELGAGPAGTSEALMRAARQALERARALFVKTGQARDAATQELPSARRTADEIRDQARAVADSETADRSHLIEEGRRRDAETVEQERPFLERALSEAEKYSRQAREIRADAERARGLVQSLRV